MPRLRRHLWVLWILPSLLHGDAEAHPLAPSLLELKSVGQGEYDVRWKTPLLRASGSTLSPVLPEHCRAVGVATQEREATAQVLRWRVDCAGSELIGSTFAVEGLDQTRTAALLRIEGPEGVLARALLTADAPSHEIGPPASRFSVARDYTSLGFEHILAGADHLLFVLGLLLLIDGRRKLLLAITAFTVGHSITLALASLDRLTFPASLAELGIAISLIVVAVELCRPSDAAPSVLRRRPWGVAFGFGLLHGMGFAGALRETGLPNDEVPLALLSFNVGIELGQLVFIAGVLVAMALTRGRIPLPRWAPQAPGYLIGSLAVFWIFERSAWLF